MSGGKAFAQVAATPFEFPLVGDFTPSTTCLLVIDLQRDFTEEGGYMTAMGYDVTPLSAPLKPVAAVLAACREVGMRIIHTVSAITALDNAPRTFMLRKSLPLMC